MLEIKIAIVTSIVSYVYTEVLLAEGNILWWWWCLVHKHIKSTFWLKPITDCCLCVSGQMALWTYVFVAPFSIFGLIFTICLSILLTKIYHRWS